jgi:N-acetylneuraminate synthase
VIIDRNIIKYVVFIDDSLAYALQKISDNKSGLVFALSQHGVLEGILTDGDFRRWLLSTTKTDLALPVLTAVNRQFLALPEATDVDDIRAHFNERVGYVPLVDKQGRLVSIAINQKQGFAIGEFDIHEDSPPFVIAEIGNNHNGDLSLAYQLIEAAVAAGADCAKFQMRDMKSMYRQASSAKASEDLGAQYTLDLLSRFQLSNKDMLKAFDYCQHKGIMPLCTPWDIASVEALENYGMLGYKVASADLTNPDLLKVLAKTRKPLICSTGMSEESEIKEAVTLLNKHGAQYALLHCNSTYPAPFKDIHLNYLSRLKSIGTECLVGYSGHERGYAVAIAAVAKGAKIIEKHLTLDRNMEGNDHRVSLLPNEFADMVRGIREVGEALGTSDARRVSQGEMMNREVLGKSVLATKMLSLGAIISADDLTIRSPGKGLPAYRKDELIGKQAKRDMVEGDFFYPSDLDEQVVVARPYHFTRPFGVPVRYHDVESIVKKSNFDLLEFHLSYQDMALNPEDYLSSVGYNMDFVVHAPELFKHDFLVDLCSSDTEHRLKSIQELKNVARVVCELKPYFKTSKAKVLIVANVGGYSFDHFLSEKETQYYYEMVHLGLKEVEDAFSGVEMIPQTLPPFPWFFGGQRYSNILMSASSIVNFCTQYNRRICLDLSHSKLYCNYVHASFSEFVGAVAPFAAHLHLVDASGVDGEGVQIDEGDIDFNNIAAILNKSSPTSSFIPEIWQGHKNAGEGFWLALERLEKYFG